MNFCQNKKENQNKTLEFLFKTLKLSVQKGCSIHSEYKFHRRNDNK